MKKNIVLCFFLSVFVAGSAFAQTPKVVVIPLNSARILYKTWTAVNFITTGTNIVNGCPGGTEYIKQSDFNPLLYVGAMLCSADRYKLFLAFSPGGPYYEIGDGSDNGQDHCELIGGTNTTGIGTLENSPSGERGFFRQHLGEDFQFETPTTAGWWRTDWYECGISIP